MGESQKGSPQSTLLIDEHPEMNGDGECVSLQAGSGVKSA